MALSEATVKNFEVLKEAFANRDVALLDCFDTVTNQPVAAICAVNTNTETGEFEFVPFAIMPNEVLYERLRPPTTDGEYENDSPIIQ